MVEKVLQLMQCGRRMTIVELEQEVGISHGRGELSYLAPQGSEKISVPYFKQCLFRGGGDTPRLSQTPRIPVPRQK
jgi:hypothetical protein